MKRTASLVLSLMLLAACTPAPPEPTIRRYFMLAGPAEASRDQSMAIRKALEAHGIRCSVEGFIGATARCSGTEQQWKEAESAIARLTAEGIMTEASDERTTPRDVEPKSGSF